MEKTGTKSMEQLDLSRIPFVTATIAESWKRSYEKALKGQQRRKHPLPIRYLIWIEINDHPGISWRHLNQIYTKHSLSVLSWLLKRGLIRRVEDKNYSGRGRKPTRYFAISRPFVTHPGYHIGKTPIFGTLSTRKSEWFSVVIKDPNPLDKSPFKKVIKRRVTRYIQRFPEEKKWIEKRRKDDEAFAAVTQLAERKRKISFIESRNAPEEKT
jgi:hypothetical protein